MCINKVNMVKCVHNLTLKMSVENMYIYTAHLIKILCVFVLNYQMFQAVKKTH